MPTYEYKCPKCEHQFEIWQEVGAPAPPCPQCQGEVQKVFFPIRTIFKGSGFYITDSRPAASKKGEGGQESAEKNGSGESAGSKTESSPATATGDGS